MIVIRAANQRDIPALLPMIAKICALHQLWDDAKYGFLPNPELLYEKWMSSLIGHPKNLCLVAENLATEVPSISPLSTAERSPQLGGFLIATVERDLPIYVIQEYGFVHDIWVEEAYRQGGVARQLIEAAIAHFRQLNVQQLRLDTAYVNEAARKLFMSCGFRASTIEMLIPLDPEIESIAVDTPEA